MNQYEIQFAWFFSRKKSLDYEQLAIDIRQKTKRSFASPATFIPLPQSAPPEIPRMQLQNNTNSIRASISINRADFFVSSDTDNGLTTSEIDLFFKDVDVISEILLTSGVNISRLGLVGRFYLESQKPAEQIAKSLLRRSFDNLSEVSVKITERHVDDTFTYNDSYNFDQGLKIDTNKKILVVTRDINTVPEVNLLANKSIINNFKLISRERLKQTYITKVMEG